MNLFSPIVVQLTCSIKDSTYRMPSISYNLSNITAEGFVSSSSNKNNDSSDSNCDIDENHREKEVANKQKSLYDILNSMKTHNSTSLNNTDISKQEKNIQIIELTNGRYLTKKMKDYCILFIIYVCIYI